MSLVLGMRRRAPAIPIAGSSRRLQRKCETRTGVNFINSHDLIIVKNTVILHSDTTLKSNPGVRCRMSMRTAHLNLDDS